MNNGIIIGTGKIGLDLYIKLKKADIFDKVFIFNTNKFSEGAKYCKKKKFLYSNSGIIGVKKNLLNSKVINLIILHQTNIFFIPTNGF